MNTEVLWRRLTETDFNAMRGTASPHGRGGGAMHVALGVASDAFPIGRFLDARGRATVTLETAAEPGKHDVSSLTFGSNPGRRHGEWLIRDQFSHRHPAWSVDAGFPNTYKASDPPYVLIFRVGDTFHVRHTTAARLSRLPANALPEGLLSEPKGIREAPTELLAAFKVPPQSLLATFEEVTQTRIPDEPFDPTDVADGRQRVMAAIFRRLGQQSFRRKLLTAYATQCAVTRCRTAWVLEAAHITPYRGIRTNAVSNGLLLRADIHTLFDLGLISIEPSHLKIRVSTMLAKSQYAPFDGKIPALPSVATVRPSMAALEEHYSLFQP